MSSHESPSLIGAEAEDTLHLALLRVCEQSFFAFVESCDASRFTLLVEALAHSTSWRATKEDAEAAGHSAWLKASVAFDGTLASGLVEALMPKQLGRWLVASLLGISREVELGKVEVTDTQIFDGVGEFANMVCGAWLTDLDDSQAFNLEPPAVAYLPLDWDPLASVKAQNQGRLVSINDLPMVVLIRSAAV